MTLRQTPPRPRLFAAGDAWDLPASMLHAREAVDALDVLLEAVCLQLGDDTAREPLLRSLAATLAIEGREACLPLAALDFADPLRRELTRQADRIGQALASWAAEANRARRGLTLCGVGALTAFALRSRCEGHLWTSEATALLTGARGGPTVMQIYNEWLHQFVLLRDALLPFANWQEVPLPLDGEGGGGMRRFEASRETFLARFLTRVLTHASLVDFARSLFDPRAGAAEIYGFQTEWGLALPSVVGSEAVESAPSGLLRWHKARLVSTPSGSSVGFHYAFADYLAAPRSPIGDAQAVEIDEDVIIVAEQAAASGEILWLQLTAGARTWRVDLGQCLRGQRFAYRPAAGGSARPLACAVRHEPAAVLDQPGLVTAPDGIHVLPTEGHPLITLALLGKIYPENTVIASDAAWPDILAAGKGYGVRFVLGSPATSPGSRACCSADARNRQ